MQARNQGFSGTILFKEKMDLIGLDVVQVSEHAKARWSEDCFTEKILLKYIPGCYIKSCSDNYIRVFDCSIRVYRGFIECGALDLLKIEHSAACIYLNEYYHTMHTSSTTYSSFSPKFSQLADNQHIQLVVSMEQQLLEHGQD